MWVGKGGGVIKARLGFLMPRVVLASSFFYRYDSDTFLPRLGMIKRYGRVVDQVCKSMCISIIHLFVMFSEKNFLTKNLGSGISSSSSPSKLYLSIRPFPLRTQPTKSKRPPLRSSAPYRQEHRKGSRTWIRTTSAPRPASSPSLGPWGFPTPGPAHKSCAGFGWLS